MEKKEFAKIENQCQAKFQEAGECYHICSQENHPLIFHNEEELKTAMNLVAYTALLFPDISILTFEVLNNHMHFTLSGKMAQARAFTEELVAKMSSHPSLKASRGDIMALKFKFLRIMDLENLRNVIVYNNRNGAVISPDENVFTYRWGANRFFFNDEARLRYEGCGRKATCREKRKLFCSAKLDDAEVVILDGYVSPLCYCKVSEAEMFFRNNRHYFYSVSRNIESIREIATNIGESLFYTDEDLFLLIKSLCTKKYDCQSPALLPAQAKMEIAKMLRFDYNACNKQISRLLKLDIGIVSTLFPETV